MAAKQAKHERAEQMSFRTLACVHELRDGQWLAYPLAEPSLVSHGAGEPSLEELRLFLAEHLGQADPETLARFALPRDTRLHAIELAIPREDLPRRLPLTTPIRFDCAVIPGSGKDAWVVVLALDHTFWVSGKEPLDEAIGAEVRRLCVAREPTPWEYLELLPPASVELVPVELELHRDTERAAAEARAAGGGRSLKRRLAEGLQRKKALEVLGSVARPLDDVLGDELAVPRRRRGGRSTSGRSQSGQSRLLVGRERELKQLEALLDTKQRLSVLLVGPELSGKSALLQAWSEGRRRRRTASEGATRVFCTSGVQLIAGMSGLGQWQQRVKRVMEAAETLDAVLYFDNLAELFSDNPRSQVDIAGALKPFLDEDRVRVVGEITPEARDRLEGRHPGFFANLHPLRVEPLDAAASEQVLRQRLTRRRALVPDAPSLVDEAVPLLIGLVERYLPYAAYPGKAVRLLEAVHAAGAKHRDDDGEPKPLGARWVYETFSRQSGIPAFLLRDDRSLKLNEIEAHFAQRVIGQREAVTRVAEAVCLVKANLQPPGKPLSTFLFAGPTGVGKTEVAKTLASFIFGAADRMVRFDMSEYQDASAAERLISGGGGAHLGGEGLLTRRLRQQPFCVVLLDEIEKAHAAVFDLLLQVLGEGRLTDARGRTAFFYNALIIMTSNLGAAGRRAKAIGLGDTADTSERAVAEIDRAYYEQQVSQAFRPELVNRIDRVIAFAPLSAGEIEHIAEIVIQRICQRHGLVDAGVSLELTQAARAALADEGYSPRYGARALRRTLEDHLVAPLAHLLGRVGPAARGATARVALTEEEPGGQPSAGPGELLGTLEHGGLRLSLAARKGSVSPREVRGMVEVSARRRQVDSWFALERVQDVGERLAFIVAQLASASRRARKKAKRGDAGQTGRSAAARQASREAAALQEEHHRLHEIWQRAEAAREEMRAVEELALGALLEGEDVADSVGSEVEAAWRAFRDELTYLMLVQQPVRDQVTLRLEELDDRGGFNLWLAPLLGQLGKRGWRVWGHVDGDDDPSARAAAGWPPAAERRYGPARDGAWLTERLAEPKRRFRRMLLCAKGPYAGVLLALEAGLHRFFNVAADDLVPPLLRAVGEQPALLSVGLVAMTARPKKLCWAFEHKRGRLQLPLGQGRRKVPAARELDGKQGTLKLVAGSRQLALAPAGYWPALEQVALEQMLRYEQDDDLDLDSFFVEPLIADDDEGEGGGR